MTHHKQIIVYRHRCSSPEIRMSSCTVHDNILVRWIISHIIILIWFPNFALIKKSVKNHIFLGYLYYFADFWKLFSINLCAQWNVLLSMDMRILICKYLTTSQIHIFPKSQRLNLKKIHDLSDHYNFTLYTGNEIWLIESVLALRVLHRNLNPKGKILKCPTWAWWG